MVANHMKENEISGDVDTEFTNQSAVVINRIYALSTKKGGVYFFCSQHYHGMVKAMM